MSIFNGTYKFNIRTLTGISQLFEIDRNLSITSFIDQIINNHQGIDKLTILSTNECFLVYDGKKLNNSLKITDYDEFYDNTQIYLMHIIQKLKPLPETEESKIEKRQCIFKCNMIKSIDKYGETTGCSNCTEIYSDILHLLGKDEWIICGLCMTYFINDQYIGKSAFFVSNWGSILGKYRNSLGIFHLIGIMKMPNFFIDMVKELVCQNTTNLVYSLKDYVNLRQKINKPINNTTHHQFMEDPHVSHRHIMICTPTDMTELSYINSISESNYIINLYQFISDIFDRYTQ